MKPANSVLMRSSDTESAGTTAPQCRESFYLFRLSTLTGADHSPMDGDAVSALFIDLKTLYQVG